MITQDVFAEKFKKLVTLCNFPQNMANQANVEIYYDALRGVDERTLLLAFQKITKTPPNKLTLAVILHHVYDTMPKKECSDWDERECSVEGCERGLISEKIGNYSVLFRCLACNSSKLKFIDGHTSENVFNERQKHAPKKREKEPTRIETLTEEIG